MAIKDNLLNILILERNLNTKIVSKKAMKATVEHEFKEHGYLFGKDADKAYEWCFEIALDHLRENPRYYTFLKQADKRATKYWLNRTKPSIFKTT